MERLIELSKYVYSLEEVLSLTKANNYKERKYYSFEIYHAYVGRHDQPGVYDKRACMIVNDMGKKVSVYKITSEYRKTPLRYLIKDYKDINLKEPSYIRMDEDIYIIDKRWLTTFDGELKHIDTQEIKRLLSSKE